MNNKDHISDDDRALFRETIGSVRRIQHDRIDPAARPRPPLRRKRLNIDIHRTIGPNNDAYKDFHSDSFSDLFQAQYSEEPIEAGDELFFTRQGVQKKTLRRLKRGQLPCGMELDMHGLTVAEARPILAEFIDESRQRRLRCIHVIHGKGFRSMGSQPVLKSMVNNWLRQHEGVLAFCSARQADGGTGAVYVLLKS